VFGVTIGGPKKVAGAPAGAMKWAPLVGLVAAALAGRAWLPAWAFMWALAYAMYFGCKWATFRDAGVTGHGGPLWQRLGYLFLWPGMDARAFLAPRRRRGEEPDALELSRATIRTLGGLTLLFVGGPLVMNVTPPLLGGWIAMAGLVLSLHFGFFDLLSIAWRSVGIDAKPLMNAPLRATSLGEFWGARWNRGFRDLSHGYLFRPLLGRVGPVWATLGTFCVSGVIHDLVISLPAGGGYGLPTLYFMIQGVGLLVEKTRFGRRHLRGAAGRAFAIAVAALPAPLLFHPPFVERVILPFVRAMGAGPG
jgi:alginate O-acetyltransferase complex protein AlgI